MFTLTEMVKDGSTLTESKLLQEKNNYGDKVTFDSIAYEYREAPTDPVTQPTTAAPSTTRFLAKAKAQTAEPVEANGGAGVNASATVDKFYYQIAEKNLGGDTYTYDTAKYYAVVSVDRSTAPNTATVKYYPTAKDAIDETNEIANPTENVKFNNYHKGSIEISKSGADGSTFQNMAGQVEFSLYKLDSPSDELTSNNLVETKAIDNNGIVKFEDLLIFKGQNTNDTDEHQLYCFVETKAAPGYNISSEKHFFTVPYAQQCESGEASDFTIGGVGFKYLPDNDGKLIYHIKAGTVTNYPLTMPSASGDGMNGYFVLGVSVAGLAVTMFTGYAIYYGKGRKKRRARCRK